MQALLEHGKIELMPLEFLAVIGVVFAVIGFVRGVRAELWVTGMVMLGYVILHFFTDDLIAWTNRFYRLFLFGIRGGPFVEDPIEIWNKIRKAPPLIETEADRLWFSVIVFLGFYLLGFFLGRQIVKRKLAPISLGLLRNFGDLMERVLGIGVGFVNGFLVAGFVVPRVLPAERRTVIVIPSTEVVTQFMARNLVNVAVLVLVVVILLGLMASGGLRQRG
jgi:hypothetical protein